jgi:hypothetical protein
MAVRTRRMLLGLGILVLLGLGLFLLRSGQRAASVSSGSQAPSSPTAGADPEAPGREARTNSGGQVPSSQSPPIPGAAKAAVMAEFAWGSGESQLGRHRPQEASPEAPMSMAADILGNVVVLDQVNGRFVRLDHDGKVVATFPMTQQTPQDLVMARDGTLLVLDRLKDRTVAILDPYNGSLRGELPVQGKGVPEPGLITATFVDGDSVYVEREHGALIRIGDTSGTADPERPEVPGRPTRDGRSYVLANIRERGSGRILLNSVDRQTGQHRYTREYPFGFPVMSITLLDSDLSGTLYLGVAGQLPSPTAAQQAQPGVRVFCIEPLQGKVLGQVDLPLNTLPEETFRDFVVLDEGGLLYRHITDAGVTLLRAHCR